MKRHSFSNDEIEANKSDPALWISFVRRREAEIVFGNILGGRRFQRGLELGAGNGEQSMVIKNYCDKLVSTDLNPKSYEWTGQTLLQRECINVTYDICNAEDLTRYPDHSFDLVYSSNMLEHLHNPSRCLAECRRVLMADGLMVHLMPTRYWKLFRMVLFRYKNGRPDTVHGAFASHREEYMAYGRNCWKRKIEKAGFEMDEIVAMPFYVGMLNSYIGIIKLGNRLKWPACYAYISRKT
jgi:ubiquinone/menaquinone biosynthesis C-methylase UbiE